MPRPFDRSLLVSISNSRPDNSGANPRPVSWTETHARPSLASAEIVMRPLLSVKRAALFSRLEKICASRTGSPSSHSAFCGSLTMSLWPASRIAGELVSTAFG
jgi:hypothetical protein